MNLYSINTIKQELLFSPLVYRIKKSDYSRLEAEAKKQMRSVSNLSLYYILEGLKKDEEKRAEAQ